MEAVICCLIFVRGIVVGLAVGTAMICKSSVGNLRIDRSDREDGPFIFLELSEDIDKIEDRSCVILKVRSENFIPHK